MAKAIRFKKGSEIYTIDPTGVTAKLNSTKKSLNKFIADYDTLFVGNTGGTAAQNYYHIATLNSNTNDDASNLRIIGTGGGWVYNVLMSFDITISSRGANGFGVWYGYNDAWNYYDIVMYKGSDNKYRVYLHRKNITFTGYFELIAMGKGLTTLNCSDTSVSPNGTLVKTFDKNNLTKIG